MGYRVHRQGCNLFEKGLHAAVKLYNIHIHIKREQSIVPSGRVGRSLSGGHLFALPIDELMQMYILNTPPLYSKFEKLPVSKKFPRIRKVMV